MNIQIKSQVTLGHVVPNFFEADARVEPMLFNCDAEGARALGGPITKAFLQALPRSWTCGPLVIDSRTHMLMPGWFPCIPGWHHDDVPRTRADGQPNYAEGQPRSEHCLLLINGGICPTEFAVGEAQFSVPGPGKVIYGEWHRDVELLCDNGILKRELAPSGQLVFFDDRTWHRGTQAVRDGWRFFIRASRYFSHDGQRIDRGNKRTNEVRKQVQVYMENPNGGW